MNKRLPLVEKFTKILELVRKSAWMVELVDTRDLKSLSFGSEGSSPSPGTNPKYYGRINVKGCI